MTESFDLSLLTAQYLSDFTRLGSDWLRDNPVDLSEGKTQYVIGFNRAYVEFRRQMAAATLINEDAVALVLRHTAWMDAWIRFTWQVVRREEILLMRELARSSEKKVLYLKRTLPEKCRRRQALEESLNGQNGEGRYRDSAERSYYQNSFRDLKQEIAQETSELQTLEEIIPQITDHRLDEERLLALLIVFARGGYGRKELTFSSDIDLGYCVALKDGSRLEIQTIRELIKRMEELFLGLGAGIASQYFELGEDLSRFSKIGALHTIPSLLEGRPILGRPAHLLQLQKDIMKICPRERMIGYLQRQLDSLRPNTDEHFPIKEGYGGVRHLQYALWMVLIVVNPGDGNSEFILDHLRRHDWISARDEIRLKQALELYMDLRNFIGLYDCFSDQLTAMGSSALVSGTGVRKDDLDDRTGMAYLKLRNRFTTVDFLDRFRLSSMQTVARCAQSIVADILDRTISEKRPGFTLYKHLGTYRITRLQPRGSVTRSTARSGADRDLFGTFFLTLPPLIELFTYIARTGYRLSERLKDAFSALVPDWYRNLTSLDCPSIRTFIFNLFVGEQAAVAVGQMMDIAAPLSRDGKLQTLLGLFLPEVNEMRYLLRNTAVHDHPLCIHSLKALEQVEIEIDEMQRHEPGLWRFISEPDIFALKWSVFFHDVGKINPHRNHEELGPELSANMLLRLGWRGESDHLDLIRLLVANHQSMVRFSQLSTYLDLGILKFFELAQRDPGKVVLLYLINISDFKSVNAEMNRKAAHLDRFFQKTISILDAFRREHLPGEMTDIINNYLNRNVAEVRLSVLLELLLRQCCNKNLEDIVLIPLRRLAPEEAERLSRQQEELENALVYLKLAELDANTLRKYRFRFIQLLRQELSEVSIFALVEPLSKHWDWFFTTIPNRYLLSSEIEVLTTQLQQFETSRYKQVRFSYIKGDPGEYDTILFHSLGKINILAKVAYALSWRGVNIETGKINKVVYANHKEGWVGFFQVSQQADKDELSNVDLETVIAHLIIPPLNPPPISELVESNIQLQYFHEPDKGYLVHETAKDKFSRQVVEFVAVKISLYDAPFCFYKMMRSFEAIGILPQQVTITTIGNQVIDYFYVSPEAKAQLENRDFSSVLQKYLNAEISLT